MPRVSGEPLPQVQGCATAKDPADQASSRGASTADSPHHCLRCGACPQHDCLPPVPLHRRLSFTVKMGTLYTFSLPCSADFSSAPLAPNAGRQERRTVGARHERTLFAVACTPWLGASAATPPHM